MYPILSYPIRIPPTETAIGRRQEVSRAPLPRPQDDARPSTETHQRKFCSPWRSVLLWEVATEGLDPTGVRTPDVLLAVSPLICFSFFSHHEFGIHFQTHPRRIYRSAGPSFKKDCSAPAQLHPYRIWQFFSTFKRYEYRNQELARLTG